MAASGPPGLLRLPREMRYEIYRYLLDDCGQRWFPIRNLSADEFATLQLPPPLEDDVDGPRDGPDDGGLLRRRRDFRSYPSRRTSYDIKTARPTYHATYGWNGWYGRKCRLHPAILATCRLINLEASVLLYGAHSFDFSDAVDAVVPFMRDRTASTRPMVRRIAVMVESPYYQCIRPSRVYWNPHLDRDVGWDAQWAYLCAWLHSESAVAKPRGGGSAEVAEGRNTGGGHYITHLRLVVKGGRPNYSNNNDASRPETMSRSQLVSRMRMRDEGFTWIRQLARAVPVLDMLDVVAWLSSCSPRDTPESRAWASFSASIETTLKDFLTDKMNAGKEERVEGHS